MGDLWALLAAICWSVANVTIARGAGAKGDDNGAFLSILLTGLLAAAIWMLTGLREGWTDLAGPALWWFAVAGALTIFVGRVLFHNSIQWLGAVRGSSVKRLAPFFSVLLGLLLLDERLSMPLAAGMVLIFSGFGVLVWESRAVDKLASASPDAPRVGRAAKLWSNPGFVYGMVSALAYAAGNVARKYGLVHMPDPAFGAMLGSLVGAALFLLTARFMDSYRKAVHLALTRFNPWLLAAGIFASAGQLLFFVAIDHSSVSRAAMIVSSEVFLTMGLMVLVFRGREKLSAAAVVAALLGVLGTAVIMTEKDTHSDAMTPAVERPARP